MLIHNIFGLDMAYLKYFYLIVFISISLLFSGCEIEEKSEYTPTYSKITPVQKDVYIFGVHPLHNPKRLFEVYQPMIDFINKDLKNAELRLEASRNYPAYDKKLFAGHFHFSLPNPY